MHNIYLKPKLNLNFHFKGTYLFLISFFFIRDVGSWHGTDGACNSCQEAPHDTVPWCRIRLCAPELSSWEVYHGDHDHDIHDHRLQHHTDSCSKVCDSSHHGTRGHGPGVHIHDHSSPGLSLSPGTSSTPHTESSSTNLEILFQNSRCSMLEIIILAWSTLIQELNLWLTCKRCDISLNTHLNIVKSHDSKCYDEPGDGDI